jgi:Ser/Thr protein kinase RdoA (MazF antagonist)
MSRGSPAPPDLAIVTHVAAVFGLGAVQAACALGGTASSKWRVETPQGRFVIRRRPAEFAGRDATQFDHALLARLADAGFPVPRPFPRPNGATTIEHEGGVYEALAWIEGEPLGEGDPRAIAGVGSFLARFHQTLAGDVPPGKASQLREDHPDLLTPYLADLYGRVADRRDEQQLDALAGQLQAVRDQLDAGLYSSLPHGVVHGDVHPGNFRFRDGEVSAVYDFDYLSVQAQVRDVCDAIMFFASKRETPLEPDRIQSLTQPFVPDLEQSALLLRGYGSRRPLVDREWRALPWLMRSRWLQMRLRGSRKVPAGDKVQFVLDRMFEVIDWLDREGEAFFRKLNDYSRFADASDRL